VIQNSNAVKNFNAATEIMLYEWHRIRKTPIEINRKYQSFFPTHRRFSARSVQGAAKVSYKIFYFSKKYLGIFKRNFTNIFSHPVCTQQS